jgi:hypothetical protein
LFLPIKDEPRLLRNAVYKEAGTNNLKLEGKLKGVWILTLEQSWRELHNSTWGRRKGVPVIQVPWLNMLNFSREEKS